MREFVVRAAAAGRAANLCVEAENAEQAARVVQRAVRVPDRVMPRGSASTGGFRMRPVNVVGVKPAEPMGFR